MQAFPFSSSPYVEILVGVNFGRMMSYEQTATSTGLVTCICGYQIFEFFSTTTRRSNSQWPRANSRASWLSRCGYRPNRQPSFSRSGSMRPFKVQATWSAAIPQLAQKARKFLHPCLFLASALRGLSSIYAMYRGRGLGYRRDCFSGGWG